MSAINIDLAKLYNRHFVLLNKITKKINNLPSKFHSNLWPDLYYEESLEHVGHSAIVGMFCLDWLYPSVTVILYFQS